jgi:copper(I)-binding protein
MTLYNSDDQDHALVAVASPAAKFVELHTHNLIDDMMQMRRVAQLELPAGIRVNLKPGGLHLMLIGLQQPLVAGEAVPLRLTFEDNSKLELSLPVRGLPRPRQQEVPGHTHQDQVKHPEEEHRP